MKILHYVVVPTDERFAVLSDAIIAARGEIGVAAIYDNGLQVLLSCNICVAEFDRVAREHLALFRELGRRPAWYEMEVG